MANYEIEPNLLQKFVPKGVDLDFYDGSCYVSLVAFKFTNTNVLGVPVPFHINFEEVNLRFYVRRKTSDEIKRGVVFIKEIVPRMAISFIARAFYGEPYETWKTSCAQVNRKLSYRWSKAICENNITIEVGESLGVPAENSHGEFIVEHYWGYTKRGENRTDEYKVEHPKWELFEVNNAEIDVDFNAVYGGNFSFLSDAEPQSILLAKGSAISVYKGEKIV